MAYFDAHLRYSDVLYYLNIAKKEVLKKISWAIGGGGRGPRGPPSKYAHGRLRSNVYAVHLRLIGKPIGLVAYWTSC